MESLLSWKDDDVFGDDDDLAPEAPEAEEAASDDEV